MKLKELRSILNVSTVDVEHNGKEKIFIKDNGKYSSIAKDSKENMYELYGEYTIKEIYTEEDILFIVI